MYLRKRQREKLKDLIIDYIYHYCFNEVVKTIEAGTFKISLDTGVNIKDSPDIQQLIKVMSSFSGNKRMYYDTRNDPYCKLIEKGEVLRSFMEILQIEGYNKENKLRTQIENAIQYLVIRSYIKRNNPKITELSLTQKGIQHYETGRSFEENYIKGRNASIALVISLISIVIALASFSFGFLLKVNDLRNIP